MAKTATRAGQTGGRRNFLKHAGLAGSAATVGAFPGLMASPAFVRDLASDRRQENSAIGLAGDETFRGQSGEHLGDGRLRNAQSGGDIDLACFVAVLDQIRDEFDIVLDERAAPRLSGVPETLGMSIGIRKRLLT